MTKAELVREFYANLTTPDANEVLVRSDLFNLHDVEQDEY